MKLLLNYNANPNSSDKNGRPLLLSAAASGNPAVVEEFLKYAPDVNARDLQGRTALMEAVGQWHYGGEGPQVSRAKVVALLLKAGADPNAADDKGMTALIECGWDADAALELIKAGANVNAKSKEGFTPMINAPDAGVVRVLLENGADPNVRGNDGLTALELARKYSEKKKIHVLEAWDREKTAEK